ncbi:MAG TPA: phosphoglucomutase/phosphomannomutase family protein [Terriglobia bacterium]|nr:phosphoglucomutase/phosphomannomutase family protein [Terriglobia bacterium]
MADEIKFGTDGWRGLIGEDFNFENVRRVIEAVAGHVRAEGLAERGVVVGYDMRFLSPEAAQVAAQVLAENAIPVILAEKPTPTPALSYAVVSNHAAAGIMITASHNPCRWNGVKVKAAYGGSAAPDIIRRIEGQLRNSGNSVERRGNGTKFRIKHADLVTPYLVRIKSLVDLAKIRSSGFRFVIDPMYGAALGALARVLDEAGIPHVEIHGEHNPRFPGLNPEPIEPHIRELRTAVTAGNFHAGFATDGDADRLGAVDQSGSFVDSHKIFSILLKHLVEDQGRRGEVVRTFSTTQMIDKIARKHQLPVHVTPIGFKYICELMLTRDILIGGEESGGIGVQGHLPERDGILNSLLLAEVMAVEERTLGEIVKELSEEFGPHYYSRVDLEIDRERINRTLCLVKEHKVTTIAGRAVSGVEDLDGLKMLFGDDAWLLVRASGTENLLRLYAEAPAPEAVEKMLAEITAIAQSGP